jgi:regulator of sigma E protease
MNFLLAGFLVTLMWYISNPGAPITKILIAGPVSLWFITKEVFASFGAVGGDISLLGHGGVVAVGKLSHQAVNDSVNMGSWLPVLTLAVALNVAVGVTNILPIPALDGGGILFVFIELVTGRRFDRLEKLLSQVVLVLIGLMIAIQFVNDLRTPMPDLNWWQW